MTTSAEQIRLEHGLDLTRPFRLRWTREDCERFEQGGLLTPGKYELIEGDLIQKMGQNRAHINTVMIVIRWLFATFGEAVVQGPGPIDVSPEDHPTNRPEPDATLLRRPLAAFNDTDPRPDDVLLLIEVSDATRYFDRGIKANLYARAGILEYWSLDLSARVLYVFRDPVNGAYASIVTYSANETVSLLATPSVCVLVGDLLPPELD